MKQAGIGIAVAAFWWFLLFSPWTAPYIPFWIGMSTAALCLFATAYYSRAQWCFGLNWSWKQFGLGVAIAAALWGVFWLGDKISQLLFDFARPQVDLIYGMKDQSQSWVIALELLLLIGPAEELFWRGFIQQRFAERISPTMAWLVTAAIYTLVHLWSFNFMLIMSALVAGALWGLLYRLRPEWLPALVISHALWDVAAFVVFPI
ncbi:MAG: CPBP family intramembrane metalloprotease [Paludibacteraceae bacterium]|nr:CPBP family intramembrane metalloprotease [Paludibacteraceae bacterium]